VEPRGKCGKRGNKKEGETLKQEKNLGPGIKICYSFGRDTRRENRNQTQGRTAGCARRRGSNW